MQHLITTLNLPLLSNLNLMLLLTMLYLQKIPLEHSAQISLLDSADNPPQYTEIKLYTKDMKEFNFLPSSLQLQLLSKPSLQSLCFFPKPIFPQGPSFPSSFVSLLCTWKFMPSLLIFSTYVYGQIVYSQRNPSLALDHTLITASFPFPSHPVSLIQSTEVIEYLLDARCHAKLFNSIIKIRFFKFKEAYMFSVRKIQN